MPFVVIDAFLRGEALINAQVSAFDNAKDATTLPVDVKKKLYTAMGIPEDYAQNVPAELPIRKVNGSVAAHKDHHVKVSGMCASRSHSYSALDARQASSAWSHSDHLPDIWGNTCI